LLAKHPDAVFARILARLVVLAGVLAFYGPAHALQVDIGPESIVMQGKYDKPALFPHRRHQDWHGCTACHHAKDRTMTIGKCEACHNGDMANGQLDSVRKASHVLCKDCHSRERAKGRTAAPSQCRACHSIEKTAAEQGTGEGGQP
jgi:hypothetical protein